ncbi:membrane protein YqaA with SNARE-associated domain [Kitasatospora sp. MAP12-15]|uniref:hypothetical protein n=1 Tax=unclassified Kitasatospora TaxID=2633591 RepID=UPI0024735FFC|nr:hypothetical protein [Kitasatospora sp. MAP12-44]MDH6111362.1 membrane protein YqaA with SNARE-associated domain [Kitasatospora sp. MAP12-44]
MSTDLVTTEQTAPGSRRKLVLSLCLSNIPVLITSVYPLCMVAGQVNGPTWRSLVIVLTFDALMLVGTDVYAKIRDHRKSTAV